MRRKAISLTAQEIYQARLWKSQNVPQFVIGLRLGCSESVVSRAVRGLANYGKVAPTAASPGSSSFPGGGCAGGE